MTHFTPRNRRRELHVLDVENLLGNPRFRSADVATLRSDYCGAVGISPGTHIVVATSAATTALEAGTGFGQPCRLVFENGQDGADHALLAVLLEENVAQRFDAVVIGSGDHCFALAARYLRNHGVHVTVVVANRRSLSNALRKEADRVIVLDQSSPTTFGDAA